MSPIDGEPALYTRRDFGKLTLAALPLSVGLRGVDSRIKGVQIGAISYSFRGMSDPEEIIKAMVSIGIGEVELMSNHAEALAGAPSQGRGGRAAGPPAGAPPAPAPDAAAPAAAPTPPGAAPAAAAAPGQGGRRGRAPLTPEQVAAQAARAEELRNWRASVSMDKYKAVRKKFDDAGIELRLLCYNMNARTTAEEMEYAFTMARALGVRAMSSSTQVSVAKLIAPFADKHKMMVGFHGHDNVTDPDEFATPESFATALTYSKYFGINLDIGHFTAANFEAVPYIQQHHDRITNLHLKDMKRDHGPYVPWGQGDAPIKAVLQLLRDKKWDIPANIEFEYPGDAVTEVTKCYQFCKDALA